MDSYKNKPEEMAMLQGEITPNYTGITISGDYLDFMALYDSLYCLVRSEEEVKDRGYAGACLRVFAICYDLTHSDSSHSPFKLVDNGLGSIQRKNGPPGSPLKNAYLCFNVLMPEILFVLFALNYLIELYEKDTLELAHAHAILGQPNIAWDAHIVQGRLFQAAVAKCLQENLSAIDYEQMCDSLNHNLATIEGYISQYIDVLNDQWIEITREERMESIPLLARSIIQKNNAYRELERMLMEAIVFGLLLMELIRVFFDLNWIS